MGNLIKYNPVGLDVVIDNIQRKVYELKDLWGVELDGYPRCQILMREGKKTIEAYLGNDEYSGSLIFAEENKFFMLAGESIEHISNTYYKTTIEIYFILDLDQIYPSIQHRADEEVRVDVLNVLNAIQGINVLKVEHNTDKVFARFNNRISQNYEHEYTDDMQPYHYFKVLIDILEYDINQTSCN
jgi:hypothetical protein